MKRDLRRFDSEEILHFFPAGITPVTDVSKFSKFGDDYWYFYDENNPRLRNHSQSHLTISWRRIESLKNLPDATVQVVKLFAFLYLYVPSALGQQKKGKAKNHPVTVCYAVDTLVPFLAHVHEKSVLESGTLPPAASLHDITVRHLRESLLDWNHGRGEDLRRALIYLASPTIQKACNNLAPKWRPSDIRSLSFRERCPRTDYEPVLPNELFRLVSNSATADVVGFLSFCQEKASSDIAGHIPSQFSGQAASGPMIFEAYVAYRLRQGAWNHYNDNGNYGEGIEAKRRALERLGTTGLEFYNYIQRVHEAACSLIALYTGARYSDLTGFKNGCLQKLKGMWFLVGTHIKHEDIDKPVDTDLWPAIPAMRDALRCLELFSQFTRNAYLICSLVTRSEDAGKAYSTTGLTNALNRYIRRIDQDDTWCDVRVSPHRCRHTLAHQLARADVGLVFIAHQLKHLHSALKAVPPQVTLLYGRIADLKTERAMQASEVHYEMAQSLYDPNSPIAGGGAEEFTHRRKQYFEGMLSAGMTKDEIIRGLASKAIPFSSVGMGYCLGRREIKDKDGRTQKPPCIGSLQCSPDICSNSVITWSHVHLWKKVASQNREMAMRPDMQHVRTELLDKSARADMILSQLGIDQ
ncbi:site-specific integrase [Ralstonia wenshanensis]|uniref:site-specific integrase n=1 Tax=Ralstonia wenshanensis TaxID=2842456 RepID=UPI0021B42361|nr:site-specific integrase [Ralstonia wenshanensis]MCT7307120.1 site-specific integrase [Ralstonia wenshanensis]